MKFLTNLFSFLNGLMGNVKTHEDKKAGGEKVDLEGRKAYDKSRKKAQELGNRKHGVVKSNGMHRKPNDGDTPR